MMKIAVMVRTRNEAHRIETFCKAYRDADYILVSDGGSEDNTVELASKFPNVLLRPFTEQKLMADGSYRNNDSDHANFLFAWAKELDADWVIYDDCDCVPNKLLQDSYRKIMEETNANFIHAVRLYFWGTTQHFPMMAKPTGDWQPSLWAWRNSIDFWTVDVPPAYDFRIGGQVMKDLRRDTNNLDIFPPQCLLHMSWDDPERVEKKVENYRKSGLIPGMLHPLNFAGYLEKLPEWAVLE